MNVADLLALLAGAPRDARVLIDVDGSDLEVRSVVVDAAGVLLLPVAGLAAAEEVDR